jgi:hypothetical protein
VLADFAAGPKACDDSEEGERGIGPPHPADAVLQGQGRPQFLRHGHGGFVHFSARNANGFVRISALINELSAVS